MGLIADYGMTFPQRYNARGFFEFTGDIQTLVRMSILQILGTKIGERVMLPDFGSRLPELLHEPIDSITISLAKVYTIEAIKKWEPRVQLNSVITRVNPDQNLLEIYGSYVIVNRNLPDDFSVAIPRLVQGGG